MTLVDSLRTGARELAKSSLARAAHHAGVLPLAAGALRRLRGARVHILAFHRVVDDLDALPEGVIRSLCITTSTFERLVTLAARHFDVVPLAVAAEAVLDGNARRRRDLVALTFDDGYRDVYLRAWPVLRRLGLPATAFIPSGYVGSPQPLEHDRLHALLVAARRAHRRLSARGAAAFAGVRPVLAAADAELISTRPDAPAAALDLLIARLPAHTLTRVADELEANVGPATAGLDDGSRVMNADELRAIAEGGIEVGAHTVGHVALVHEPLPRVRRELESSRADLEAMTGRPCRSFAYCNGLWHPALVDAVRAAGYQVAVTTRAVPNGRGDDPLLLGRKTFWEGHARGLDGRFSEARVLAHLYHLFGALALARPVDGRVDGARVEEPWIGPRRA